MSIVFAGTGVPGGRVIGATVRVDGDARDERFPPAEYAATVDRKTGIDPDQRLAMLDHRPVNRTDGGRAIDILF